MFYKKEVIIKKDLKARAAAQIVEKAKNLECSLHLQKNSRKANLKSLIGVLSLDLKFNDKITIISDIDNINIIISIMKEEELINGIENG